MSIPDSSAPRRHFRPVDAQEVKPDFILGTPIGELAERLAAKRGTSFEQALHYLERIRARDSWIRERELHLAAVAAHAQKKAITDRATALAAEQAAVADRLVQLGVDELATTKALSRQDALKTLELGFKFHYRSIGQPDHVIDPSLVQAPGDASAQASRANQLQGMSKSDLMAIFRSLIEQQPAQPSQATGGAPTPATSPEEQ